jgi:serine protease AprX
MCQHQLDDLLRPQSGEKGATTMQSNKARSVTWGKTIFIGFLFFFSASLLFSAPQKMSKDLIGNNGYDQVDVIVQFTQTPTAFEHQKVFDRGGTLKQTLGQFKGAAYRLPAYAIEDLSNDPEVVYVSPDRPLKGASNPAPALVNDFHYLTINANYAASKGLYGAGIGVAVIDSGIANVPDITAKNVVYSQDFTGIGSTVDQYGHGTHVTGILAGNGAESIGSAYNYTFMGAADGVSLINLRVLDQNGAGNDSQVIAAIQEAIALKSKYNIRVINLSLGRPVWESYKVDPLCQAVEQAWKAGIVVVVAAGNYGRDNNSGTNGYGTITAPGNDPYVITVGAMNSLGTSNRTVHYIASYSSKGPTLIDNVVKPDIVAPGNLMVSLYFPASTLNQNYPQFETPLTAYLQQRETGLSGSYFNLSGTSMATPEVSAAAALMLEQTPALTPDQVKARLMVNAFKGLVQSSVATDLATGQTFDEQADVFTVGAGYLDIQAALTNTQLAPATVGSALSPIAVKGSNGSVTVVPNGSSILGGTSILWGTATNLWGSSILWGTGSETAESILWGTGSTLTSSSILWGTASTSSDSILWGTSETQVDGSNVLFSSTTGDITNDQE